jgi:hypothetical protein
MNGYGRGLFNITPLVKNIIMINILMFLAYLAGLKVFNINLN